MNDLLLGGIELSYTDFYLEKKKILSQYQNLVEIQMESNSNEA